VLFRSGYDGGGPPGIANNGGGNAVVNRVPFRIIQLPATTNMGGGVNHY
jgi:hypothetical protein